MPKKYNIHTRNAIYFLLIALITTSSLGIVSLSDSKDSIVSAAGCGDVYDALPRWIRDAVAKNKNAYVKISNETGVPWQMLAAIHYRENNMARYNPDNGGGKSYGIFQFTPPPEKYKIGSVSYSEFVRQLRYMAKKIQSDYVFRNSLNPASVSTRKLTKNEKNISLIKNTLYSYNGRNSQYANQAKKYGFNPSTRPYEGSPYVMNMFDCKRKGMGTIKRDYGPIEGAPDTRYGTFTLFARLKGDSYWKSLQGFEFKKMSLPRWMQLKQDTRKIDPFSKEQIGSTLQADRQIYFDQKIIIDGQTYLRSEHDTDELFDRVIPISLLEEVDINYSALEPQRWLEIEKDLYKIDPRTKKKVQKLPAGTRLYGNSKTEVGGALYIRSKYDTENNIRSVVPYSAVNTVIPEYSSLVYPRWFISKQITKRYDLRYASGTTTPNIPIGTRIYGGKKIDINGRINIINNTPAPGQYIGTPLDHLRSISSDDIKLRPTSHRAYRTTVSLRKTDLVTGQLTGQTLSSGSKLYLESFMDLGGERYMRTAFDTRNDNSTVISRDRLEPIEVEFENMTNPRSLRLIKDTRKIDPITKQSVDVLLDKSRTVSFSQKVTINGKTYLRTSYDSRHSHYRVIPMILLDEL